MYLYWQKSVKHLRTNWNTGKLAKLVNAVRQVLSCMSCIWLSLVAFSYIVQHWVNVNMKPIVAHNIFNFFSAEITCWPMPVSALLVCG